MTVKKPNSNACVPSGITLTRHARKRWRERVGTDPPGPAELQRLIDESLLTRRPAILYTPRGFPVRILAQYMHKDLAITLKVDPRARKVVTVVG